MWLNMTKGCWLPICTATATPHLSCQEFLQGPMINLDSRPHARTWLVVGFTNLVLSMRHRLKVVYPEDRQIGSINVA